MASVQSVPLGLLALLAWTRCGQGGARWTVVTGLLLALTFWHHPLCGAVALGAILLHGGVSPLLARGEPGRAGSRFALAGRAAGAAALAGLLSAPLLLQNLRALASARRHGGNEAAYHWFAPELHDPRFALHAHAPVVVLLGVAGLWLSARRWRAVGWLPGYFAVGLVGQALGYLGHDRGWPLPWVLPHEFQWHEQLALMIAAAVAIVELSSALANRVPRAARATARWAGALALLALGIGPALSRVEIADLYPMRLDQRWASMLATARWVRGHTALESVFVCTPDAGYDISGLTGRKCVVLPPGHMNPAANFEARLADVRDMLTTRDEHVFLPLARRYRADYLLALPEPGTSEALRGIYDRWDCLEATDLADSAMLVYRIRPGPPR